MLYELMRMPEKARRAIDSATVACTRAGERPYWRNSHEGFAIDHESAGFSVETKGFDCPVGSPGLGCSLRFVATGFLYSTSGAAKR
jgi:hypothetical protein